jgi:hypothetical protein
MHLQLLFDIPPGRPPVSGGAGLSVLLVVVVALSASLIAGVIFLVMRIKRRRRRANELAANVRPSSKSAK